MKRKKMKQILVIIMVTLNFIPYVYLNTAYAINTNELSVDTSKYCYYQLTDTEKEIYNNFINSKEKFINNQEVYCTRISYQPDYYEVHKEAYNSTLRAMQAYLADNPDAEIWVKNFKTCEKLVNNGDDYYYDVSIIPFGNGYVEIKPEEIRTSTVELEDKVTKFVKTLHGTDYEKLLQIHNWLVKDSTYDMMKSNPNRRSAYGAIIQKKATCSGYSYGFKYIADKAGLNVICVSGTATNYDGVTGRHSWNLAYIDGTWKLIDVTWDLQSKNKKEFFCKSIDVEIKSGRHIPEKYFFSYPQ